jgi:hypothetical protein
MKKKRGTVVVEHPFQPSFYSERGFPLITQYTGSKAMLTVENYIKWYNLYIITEKGEVVPVDYEDIVESRGGLTWVDHAISPEAFHLTAKSLGLEYDDMTFAIVCQRFVEDFLEDWTKLHHHLPKQ